jgi:repressor LexA
MLTRKQHELLIFIDHHLRTTGFSPSFEEMKDALSLRSKSGIHRLISALEERGFLRRHHHRARALEVVKLPEKGVEQAARVESPAFAPNVIRGDFGGSRLAGVRAASDAAAVQLPLYGRIAAGQPIEALRDSSSHIEVPMAMLGQIVVAMIDDSEVTLKRLRRRGNTVVLEPANPNYEVRILPADRVKVQGRLVGLLRRY